MLGATADSKPLAANQRLQTKIREMVAHTRNPTPAIAHDRQSDRCQRQDKRDAGNYRQDPIGHPCEEMLSAPERIPFFRIVRQELDFASNSLIQRLPIACREESSPSCSTGSQRSIAVPKLRPSARWQAGRGTGPSWRSAIRLPVASPSKLSESAVNTHGLSPMMSRPPSPPVSIVPWMRAPRRRPRRPCKKAGARANGRDEREEQSPPFSFNPSTLRPGPQRFTLRMAVWKLLRARCR
jgi:hypothetical protein